MIPPPLSNYTCGASNPNPTCLKPFDKACTIDCVLPKLVPQIAADLNVHVNSPIPHPTTTTTTTTTL